MAELVRAEELDMAFVGLFADQLPADLSHRILTDEPLVAALPCDHAPAKRPPISPASPRAPSLRCAPSPGCAIRPTPPSAAVRRIAFELATSDAVVRFVALAGPSRALGGCRQA